MYMTLTFLRDHILKDGKCFEGGILMAKLFLAAALSLLWTPAFAVRDSITNAYTEDHPVVYEGAWDLWPYSFLNDNGEPVGYNIDLLRLIFKELDIPYRVKLKPKQDALKDLKDGRADLMCTMGEHYHKEYAKFSKSVIQIFTASIVHHKSEKVFIRSVEDLASQRIIVHLNSFSHHLMMDHGWENNAIPYDDMQEAVQYVHNHPGSQILWNTMSLKWLIHKFGYDDMELTPVNIPHGEYKFLSNDERLLEQIDSVFTQLNSTGRLQAIQNKWFYPERQETGIPSWVWYVVAVLLVIIVSIVIYYVAFTFYERWMMKSVRRSNDRLSLILHTSKVYIWLFDIATKTFTSIAPSGKRYFFPLSPNFGKFYILPEDYERLRTLLCEMADQKTEHKTTEIQARKMEGTERYVFSVDFSVMKRDKKGTPTVIIGATTNITALRKRQQEQKDTMLRYQNIFNSAIVDTVSYDEHGYIDDMNRKSKKSLGGDIQHIIDARISVQEVLGMPDLSLDDLDYIYLTQLYKSPDDKRPLIKFLGRDELYYELQLVPIRDDDGHLLGIYGTGRDVTEVAKSYSRLQKNITRLQEANDELQGYVRNIDYVMKNGGVRIVNYSPDTHTLTIYSEIEHVQHRLTQTRLLSLIDKEYRKAAQRIMNNMDNLTRQPFKTVIKSTLRIGSHASKHDKDGVATPGSAAHRQSLYLSFSFVPVTDADGHVTEYFGMCRDVSDIKATEEQLALETKKALEVETVKDAFLHNMCNEIRPPINSIVRFSELIENIPDADNEKRYIEEIKKHSRNLLTLINNILLLSRLDAGMIEIKTTPVDFAAFFEGRCKSVWENSQQPGVDYIVEMPYNHLMLDIDLNNLGTVIDQIVTNAIQHTTEGYVRAHFDYNGEDLTVAVQDTGCGIPANQFEKIFERFDTTHSGGNGLGLPICQEIVKLMGGRIRLKSEVGKGSIFWVIIPCVASGNAEFSV